MLQSTSSENKLVGPLKIFILGPNLLKKEVCMDYSQIFLFKNNWSRSCKVNLSFSPTEHLFKIAILFVFTVSICYTNKFFKTRLTANLVFLFFALAVCLQFVSQFFRNLQNDKGDRKLLLLNGWASMSSMW